MSVRRLDEGHAGRPVDVAQEAFGIDLRSAQWPAAAADRFARLRERFVSDTEFMSSVHEMIASTAFRDIVAMDREAVPFLLEDLHHDEAPWVAWAIALRKILGDGPEIPGDEAGVRDRVVARWIAWNSRPG